MNSMVIPGVQVSVTKEPLVPQLPPSGIIGIVGVTADASQAVDVVASWQRLVELYGASCFFTMPEAMLAFQNGASEMVVSPVGGGTAASAEASGTVTGEDKQSKPFKIKFKMRAVGTWAHHLSLQIKTRQVDSENLIDLFLRSSETNQEIEVLRSLSINSVSQEVFQRSKFILVDTDLKPLNDKDKVGISDETIFFKDGVNPNVTDFTSALDKFSSSPDIEIVIAAIPSDQELDKCKGIYDYMMAHCRNMSSKSCGRIGLGQFVPGKSIDDHLKSFDALVSDRFVMVAPHGAAGAIAGMIASLDYQESPTFKPLFGLTDLSPRLLVEEQEKLLNRNIVPVVTMRGRGTIVLRGLTTDGDQINVRRIADRAVRGVRMIGELFIGRLNTAAGRGALHEKLNEFLIQMVRDGALVPSAVGNAPPFQVSVSSSNDDFAKGIVRVQIAVRPVRAIDYIYASVLVET